MNPQNNKNLILATSLSVIIMISWTWFYEKPRLEKISLQHEIEQSNKALKDEKSSEKNIIENSNPSIPNVEKLTTEVEKKVDLEEKNDILTSFKTRKEIIEKTIDERIEIESKSLHGSINLKGAKFDDLTLAKYFKNPDKKD